MMAGTKGFPLLRRFFFPCTNSIWEGALYDAPREIFTKEGRTALGGVIATQSKGASGSSTATLRYFGKW